MQSLKTEKVIKCIRRKDYRLTKKESGLSYEYTHLLLKESIALVSNVLAKLHSLVNK